MLLALWFVQLSLEKMLNHILLHPIQAQSDNGKVPFVLAEMVTDDNSSFNIEFFLREFMKCFTDAAPPKLKIPFHEVVTDKSWANINAKNKVFNSMSML